jgi:hypothetical protein
MGSGMGGSKMARLLFRITEVLTIPNRGIVLLPGLNFVGDERFRVGEPLLLKRPDGTVIDATIGAIQLLKRLEPLPCEPAIMLTTLCKEDVPIGTEVWSVDSA